LSRWEGFVLRNKEFGSRIEKTVFKVPFTERCERVLALLVKWSLTAGIDCLAKQVARGLCAWFIQN